MSGVKVLLTSMRSMNWEGKRSSCDPVQRRRSVAVGQTADHGELAVRDAGSGDFAQRLRRVARAQLGELFRPDRIQQGAGLLALEEDLRGLLVELLRRHLELLHLVELGAEVAVHRCRLAGQHPDLRHGRRRVARFGKAKNLVAEGNPVEQKATLAAGLDRQGRPAHRDDRPGQGSTIPCADNQAADRTQILGGCGNSAKEEENAAPNPKKTFPTTEGHRWTRIEQVGLPA
jgi:hypothetical protein